MDVKLEKRDDIFIQDKGVMMDTDIDQLFEGELADALALLAFDWPRAKELLDEMASHISLAIYKENHPLIKSAFEKVIVAYRTSVFQGHEKMSDTLRLAVLVKNLLDVLCDEMEFVVVSGSGDSWSIESNKAFQTWQFGQEGDFHAYKQPYFDRTLVRQKLYEEMTSPQLKRVLKRAKYEAAVMDVGLGAGDRVIPGIGLCPRRLDGECD